MIPALNVEQNDAKFREDKRLAVPFSDHSVFATLNPQMVQSDIDSDEPNDRWKSTAPEAATIRQLLASYAISHINIQAVLGESVMKTHLAILLGARKRGSPRRADHKFGSRYVKYKH
jgi:hypothetical protein